MLHTRSYNTDATVSENGSIINPLNAELNPICHLLALLGAHHILHISRIRVKRYTRRHNQESHKSKFVAARRHAKKKPPE